MKPPLGISTTEAARRIGVSKQTVRAWCEQKSFGVRVGGRWRVPEEHIAEIESKFSDAAAA